MTFALAMSLATVLIIVVLGVRTGLA